MDGFVDLTFFVSTTLTYLSIKSQPDTKCTNRVRPKNETMGTSFAAFAIAHVQLFYFIIFKYRVLVSKTTKYV